MWPGNRGLGRSSASCSSGDTVVIVTDSGKSITLIADGLLGGVSEAGS